MRPRPSGFGGQLPRVIEMAHDVDADAIILISEQYTVNVKKSDPRKKALLEGIIKPSEQPDKEESLVVTYIKADGDTTSLFGKINTNISNINIDTSMTGTKLKLNFYQEDLLNVINNA